MAEFLDFVPVQRFADANRTRIRDINHEKYYFQQSRPQHLSVPAVCQDVNQPPLNLRNAGGDNKGLGYLLDELQNLKLFGAGINHDMNNVLTVILGNLELLALSDSNLEINPIFKTLEEAVGMAKALSLQLTHLFHGNTLAKERVYLAELLQEATRLGLFGSNIKCYFKLSNELPLLQVDRCQIIQVIQNLVVNAVQAMPCGGQLEVVAALVELVKGQVPALVPGKYVEITVRDTGIGIAPEHLSMIFAPHFTTKTYGKGLGLAMCYAIIKQHQGYISVESQVGLGTTFRIWLPVFE